jgi:hypothetical protein
MDVSLRTTGITVLFDGARRPTCLHRDFIPPVLGRGSPHRWAHRQSVYTDDGA